MPIQPDSVGGLRRGLGEVRRIAVLRSLSLGDMVCATPALRALRSLHPEAVITLVGQAWAREWAQRMEDIDAFEALPPHPLNGEPPAAQAEWLAFVSRMRSRRLDLAVQLHGSGCISNGIVEQWGARHVLMFHEPGERSHGCLSLPWPQSGSEIGRLIRLIRLLDGASTASFDPQPVHPVRAEDREAARALLRDGGLPTGHGRGWVCVHAGAKWSSRRWPVSRFAAVAREFAMRGHRVVLTGSEAEAAIVDSLHTQVPGSVNLCGKTDLWTLGAVIDEARLLICNDTGVSHIAAARRVPSVVISCGSDVARWAPADALRHRVLWSAPPCRPCLGDPCHRDRHICALDIPPERVIAEAESLLCAPSLAGSRLG
jgi:ADP-heptose:LPS heptosyltransferase